MEWRASDVYDQWCRPETSDYGWRNLGQSGIASDIRRATALAYFVRLAEKGGGYLVRGVRGWAHPDDVRLRNRGFSWAECCFQLARSGLLVRELASAPTAASATSVFRVTDKGVAKHSGISGQKVGAIPPIGPSDQTVRLYAVNGAHWVLEMLREARAACWPRRVNGEPGWLTAIEIKKPLREWNEEHGKPGHYRWFDDTTLRSLIVGGLVEVRRVPLAWGRNTPVVVYRATDLGQAAELLEWQTPHPSPTERQEGRMKGFMGCGRYMGSGN